MTHVFFYPMAAMVLFTFLYAWGMFFTRILSVKKGTTDARYFKFNMGEPSDVVLKTGQHFTNLFEVPVLFYAGCLSYLALHLYSGVGFLCAWLFFGLRLVHAYIHTTNNKLLPRLISYALSVVAVMGMWIFLIFEVCANYA